MLQRVWRLSGKQPPALERKPPSRFEAAFYLRAYLTLHERRPRYASMGGVVDAPVLLSEVAAYCSIYHVQDAATFTDVITALDRRFLGGSEPQSQS